MNMDNSKATVLDTEATRQQQILDAISGAGRSLRPKEIAALTGLNAGNVRSAVREMLNSGLLVQPNYGYYELDHAQTELEQVDQEGEEDLVQTHSSTYLKVIGPGGRVMARIDLVFFGTTKPIQIPLDVDTDVE